MTLPQGLTEKIRAAVRALDRCGIDYAVGGAIALGFHAEPRATSDLDIDVFLPESRWAEALDCLQQADVTFDRARAETDLARQGQVSLWWGETRLDLFFAYSELHDSCQQRAVEVTFLGQPMKVLSAEDIVIWKVLFNRPKDWLDIEQVLSDVGKRFDAGYVLHWLDIVLGAGDNARARFAALANDQGLTQPE